MKNKAIFPLLLLTIFLSGCISDSESPPVDYVFSSALGEPEVFSSFDGVDVRLEPNTLPYDFSPSNIGNFSLSQEQEQFIREYGFVVAPSSSDVLFHEYYDRLQDMGLPVFVTSDSLLHSFHILYDYSLRMAELGSFQYSLADITEAMVQRMDEVYWNSEGAVRDSAKFNVAFFSVAMSLLDPEYDVLEYVSGLVGSEIELIESAAGIGVSPLFNYREDYSQYIPRGHYTRNDDLGRYFKAMMWYGRMTFRLKDPELTRSAILLVLSTQGLDANDTPVLDLWNDIYLTTSFFVGDADDLILYDYAGVILDVYGDEIDIGELNDDALLTEFIEKAKELPDPRINSSVISDQDDAVDDTKGLRFMGQRFIIDSYMFFELVYDNVMMYYGDGNPFTLVYSDAGPIRGFPRGLDVFSVLGFDEAEGILVSEGDTEYYKYDEQVEMLKEEILGFSLQDWTKNLYTTWMYSLDSLSHDRGSGWPSFMASEKWELKELYTALGSWTQLRHDTILYAKQSYTLEATAMPPQGDLKGYVEPQPTLYSRLLSLTRMAYDGLGNRGLLSEEISMKFELFDSLLEDMIEISEKEISGEVLTDPEYNLIENIGGYLEEITTFSVKISQELESDADKSVAIVADVHTDLNSLMALEEGVGYPYTIYVVVNVDGKTYMAQGPVFSYYEFKHPIGDRLTDESWQEMLASSDEPELPPWSDGFIIK